MALVLGLAAALAYGASDFVGGLLARRFSAVQVATVGQVVASVGVLLAVPLTSPAGASTASLAWGAAAGAGSALGSLALYRGLARGQMAVVAPLSGLVAAALPATAGFVLGERPSPVAVAGILLALPAVWLVSTPSTGRTEAADTGRHSRTQAARTGRRSPPEAADAVRRGTAGTADGLLAGLGFGLLFFGLDRAGTAGGLWPVAAAQVSSVALLSITALAVGAPLWPRRGLLTGAVAAGALAGGATVLYFFAAGTSLVAVAAVVTSLYPAATVVLARLVLGERFSRSQAVGLGLATVAVVLIVAG